ncbi:hypothetical protein PUN28_015193 [Cardiocondyla obscurior]|uniref:Cysteine-rich protein n=1 Tax=Cardiocondyla obscurior TaxID=286306 RepID=A0AAW2EXH9_9HYME
MICLYCDNPKDKCTCKVPVGKRSYCGLPLDVCNCRDDEGYARDCKWIVKRPENQTIYVTNWKPNWESKRGFAKNAEDLRSCFTEERQSYEKPKRGHTIELPNQRSNSFSEVMNELQRRISESACCARCWKNPCCCKSPVDQDKRKEERKVENRVKYAEIEELSISKSPNNCRCGRSPKSEHKSTLEKSIRRIGCICQLTLCKCGNSRINYRRPLAKCYYCKSLPCTCITVD